MDRDLIDRLRRHVAVTARLPKDGGLFGGDWAVFMADNFPPTPFRRGGARAARYPVSDGSGAKDEFADTLTSPVQSQFRQPAVFHPDGDVVLDRGLAGAEDGAELIEIGGPHPRLRREWEKKEGRPWPVDPDTGRPYDVAHIRAKADGGTDTVDNIRPLHPAEHRAEHQANGDYARWARRRWIAETFGGRVAKALARLSLLADLTGMLSGRIRMNSFDNFASDMVGIPSREDQQRALEERQKALNPHWKRGDGIVI